MGGDEVIAEITAQYVDGAAKFENASLTLSAVLDGTMTDVLEYDPTLDYLTGKFGPKTVVVITASSTLTAAQVYGTKVVNFGMDTTLGEIVTTLPALSARTDFTIWVETGTQDWEFEPPTGEAFILDGVALTANQHLVIGDTVRDTLTVHRARTATGYEWAFLTAVGIHAGKP